jgi:hypothetical protein
MQQRVLARAFGRFIQEVMDSIQRMAQQEGKNQIAETERVLNLTREELRSKVKELNLVGNKFELEITKFKKALMDQDDVRAYDRVVQSRGKKTLCTRIINRMLQAHLAAAFDGFCLAIHLRVANRNTVMKTIGRWRSGLYKAWSSWVDNVKELRDQRGVLVKGLYRKLELLDKVVVRMRNIGVFKAMCSWLANVQEGLRQKKLLKKMVQRVRNRRIYKAFATWDMSLRESQREMAVLQKMTRIRRYAEMWMTCTSWYDNVQDLRRRKSVLEKVTLRFRNTSMYKALHSWDIYLREVRRLQGQLHKMALRTYFQHHLLMTEQADSDEDSDSDSDSD